MTRGPLVRGLASALCAGAWVFEGLRARAIAALDEAPEWLDALVLRTLQAFPARPKRDELAAFLWRDRELSERSQLGAVVIRRWLIDEPQMSPGRWPVPTIPTTGDLARWLHLTNADLGWFADLNDLNRTASNSRLQHYKLSVRSKPRGGVRILEAPKQRLKAIQRQVLREILDHVPAHEAAHGFRPEHSVRTFAAPHVGKPIVIKIDLEDFFASIAWARITATFVSMGYPREVARTLSSLCCSRVPPLFWASVPRPVGPDLRAAHWRTGTRLGSLHLPQGAPTSPALANLCAHRLDCRIDAAARKLGATYTRYADDLAFSGGAPLEARVGSLVELIDQVAHEEGFRLNQRKTRVMRTNGRQYLAGVVVNARVNVARDEYDRLKATVHNCVRFGPSTQTAGQSDFRAQLLGRISWIALLNPSRGEKLRRAFDRIDWSASSPRN